MLDIHYELSLDQILILCVRPVNLCNPNEEYWNHGSTVSNMGSVLCYFISSTP